MVKVIESVNIGEPVRGVPRATKALVFYERHGNACAVTEHRVVDNRLRPGRIVSLDRVGDKLDGLVAENARRMMPAKILLREGEVFAWWSKRRIAPMWFRVGAVATAYTVEWPPLLWVCRRRERSVSVYALGQSKRPKEQSPVYNAPLMNIGENGELCEGTARLPMRCDEWCTDEIEACVYDSAFTHVNHSKTLKKAADNKQHMAFWREKGRVNGRVRVSEMRRVGTVAEILE